MIVLAFSVMVATACGTQSRQSSGSRKEFLLGIASISSDELGDVLSLSGAKGVAKGKGWKVELVDVDGSAEKANTVTRNAPVHEIAPGPIIGDPG